jgi:malonyl-CoA O-methyltransferase
MPASAAGHAEMSILAFSDGGPRIHALGMAIDRRHRPAITETVKYSCMQEDPKYPPARKLIARAFSLKAGHYEQYALVQRRMAERLITHLAAVTDLGFEKWLDLGCGTGIFAELAARLARPPVSMVNLDISPDSLSVLRRKQLPRCQLLQGDIVHPPLRPRAFDLVAMSSTLQWLDDQVRALLTVNRLLRPRGVFAFAVFTAGTLQKLRSLHVRYGLRSPVSFIEAESLAALLQQTGFRLIAFNRGIEEDRFPSARAMLRSLSRIGSTTLRGKRLTRTSLLHLCQEYEDSCRDKDEVIAEYEVVVGVALKE